MKFKKVKHFNSHGCAHELTFSCFQKQDFFTDESLCLSFVKNLDNLRNSGLFKMLAYVIMPDHVHLLIVPVLEQYRMSKILASIKIPLTRMIINNDFFISANC